MELHPGVNTLHIGADEVQPDVYVDDEYLNHCGIQVRLCVHWFVPQVYMLGEGEQSKQWLVSPERTVQQLFLNHVTKVAQAVKEAWPHINIIMWDDMMRDMSQDTLKGEEQTQNPHFITAV